MRFYLKAASAALPLSYAILANPFTFAAHVSKTANMVFFKHVHFFMVLLAWDFGLDCWNCCKRCSFSLRDPKDVWYKLV